MDIGVYLSATRIPDVEDACRAVASLGLRVVQLGKLADEYYTPAGAHRLGKIVARAGVTVAALGMVYEGESYASVEAVRRTVGFLPPERVEERVAHSRRCLETAAALGVPLVTTHVGLLPSPPSAPAYQRVLGAVDRVAADAERLSVRLALETGQESAEELLALLDRLSRPVGVNFDGANFVAYGTDEPLRALEVLRARVVGVHVKDYQTPTAARFIRACPLGEGAARSARPWRRSSRPGSPAR